AGLENHPRHTLESKQQNGFGGVVSFTLVDAQGSKERDVAWRFIDATKMISITANLGDVKTTITHPATTTHGRLTPEEKQEAGITENLIRLSVGLEDIEDLQREMQRGLAAIGY